MKVKALFHLTQTIGCLTTERVMGTVFSVDENTAVSASAAGLVEIIEDEKPRELQTAKYRLTKVAKDRETK